jgi:predicted Co/Zn/Cd cation transporter (cation efflux family)
MTNFQENAVAIDSKESDRLFAVAVAVAIVLSILCCTFSLLVPTASITVDSVYQGF